MNTRLFCVLLFLCISSFLSAQQAELILPVGSMDPVSNLYYTPDGKKIITFPYGKTVLTWDVASGRPLFRFETGSGNVICYDINMERTQVVVIEDRDSLKICTLWNAETGKIQDSTICEINDPYQSVVIFSPDSKKVLIDGDGQVLLWEPSFHKTLILDSVDNTYNYQFCPGGKYISALEAAGDTSYRCVWATSTGKLLNRIPHYYNMEGFLFQDVFSPVCPDDPEGGRYCIINAPDSSPEVRESSGKILYSLKGRSQKINIVNFSPDGKYFVTGGYNTTAQVWETKTGKLIHTFEDIGGLSCALYSPDGKIIVTISNDFLFFWNAETGKLIKYFNSGTELNVAEFSPPCPDDPKGGKYIGTVYDAGGGYGRYGIEVWDTEHSESIGIFDGNLCGPAFFSPDGKSFASVLDKGTGVWDCTNGNFLFSISGHCSNLQSAEFSPDGNHLMTLQDSTLKLWNCSSMKLEHCMELIEPRTSEWDPYSYEGKKNDMIFAQFSPVSSTDTAGGKYILSQSRNNKVGLWNSSTGSLLYQIDGCKTGVQFSPDGKYVISQNTDSFYFHNTENGEIQNMFAGRFAYISPDNNFIITNHDSSCTYIETSTSKEISRFKGSFIRLSPNGRYMITGFFYREDWISEIRVFMLWDVKNSNEPIRTFKTEYFRKFDPGLPQFSPVTPEDPEGGKYLVVSSWNNMDICETASGKSISNNWGSSHDLYFSPDGNSLILSGNDTSGKAIIQFIDIKTGKDAGLLKGHKGNLVSVTLSPDKLRILSVSEDGTAIIWNAVSHEQMLETNLNGGGVFDINWKDDILVTHKNSALKFVSMKTGSEIITFIPIDKYYSITLTPDRYYMASKDAAGKLAWRMGTKIYSFEQFDLQYNRPDIVLERLWNPDHGMIDMYRKAYEKRLLKTGYNEKMFSPEWHTPDIQILYNGQSGYSTTVPKLLLNVKCIDSKYKLNRLSVWNNNVPVFGRNGISLSELNTDSLVKQLQIVLSEGNNRIQVSCTNEKGVESLKESLNIRYNPKKPALPNLYVIALSVSEYKDKRYNLQYAVKDGRDMANLFGSLPDAKEEGPFEKISLDTLFNERATREQFFELKKKLLNTKPDDLIVVFISGHGLLDENMDFYYATWDMDFGDPAARGISYNDLEGLLDSIPARKKLLMMDACHSGEVDEEISELNTTDNVENEEVAFRGVVKTYESSRGSGVNTSLPGISTSTTFDIMQEVFAGLDKGTGTNVISASAGTGYALESEEWNNGIFSYCVIYGLSNADADLNQNGVITVSELKKYVITKVEQMTRGRQKPNARRETGEFDWKIW